MPELVTRAGSTVVHIGVWAMDRVSEHDFGQSGRYAPLCGQDRTPSMPWSLAGGLRWETDDERNNAKPMCSRCRRLTADLAALVDLVDDRAGGGS